MKDDYGQGWGWIALLICTGIFYGLCIAFDAGHLSRTNATRYSQYLNPGS